MDTQAKKAWIPLERIIALVQLEPVVVILGLSAIAFLVYRFFLAGVSEERHSNIRKLFFNLLGHLLLTVMLFGLFHGAMELAARPIFARLASYVGLLTLLSMATSFVKISRIIVFEYLFFWHMRVGVPILLVNLFTLLLSLTIGAWIAAEVFNLRLMPLLATSAVLSLVIGLALQDTLGNLFAGVALQFDKPFGIGDWIEVHISSNQKLVGQVQEISWRATVLEGLANESITIPNRIVAQAQVSNFSLRGHPVIRSQAFRIPYGTPIEPVKNALTEAARTVPGVLRNPAPGVFVSEAGESWILFKLFYFVEDYGAQFGIADQVLTAALRALSEKGIRTASPRLELREVPETGPASA